MSCMALYGRIIKILFNIFYTIVSSTKSPTYDIVCFVLFFFVFTRAALA